MHYIIDTKDKWKSKTRVTNYEFQVHIYQLRVQIYGSQDQLHELRVHIYEL